jgi:transcriptional regulator with XRE-family HTH domain
MNPPLIKVREKRKSQGLSQEYMALKLEIDYSTYGKVERGKIEVTAFRLEAIAEILDVDVLDIFPFKEKKK